MAYNQRLLQVRIILDLPRHQLRARLQAALRTHEQHHALLDAFQAPTKGLHTLKTR